MKGYWRDDKAIAAAFPLGYDSGWFDTGERHIELADALVQEAHALPATVTVCLVA
jgi:long-subunit acyl-CoA synthetase (AMP-forming)